MARYTVAQIGAFIAFLPLLQVLLPVRAAAIDPLHGTALLSHVALVGALVASELTSATEKRIFAVFINENALGGGVHRVLY